MRSVTSGGETVTFTYDGDGRRVLRDTPTETIAYAGPHYELQFNKTNRPEDLDDDCVVTVIDIMRVAAQWGVQGPGIPEDVNDDQIVDIADVQQVAGKWHETCHVLAETVKYYTLGGQRIAMRKDSTLYYLFADHLGSTSVTYRTSDGQTTTQRYYPWGTIRPGPDNALPTDLTFTGQKLDADTGLMYYSDGAGYGRFYEPALGRWSQPDSIVPEPGNPQALNRYAYVYNNPVRYTDPTSRYIFEEEPADYFFIPPGRNPLGPEAMRLANDPCLGACTGAPLSDPQTTAIVQTAVGVAWEPADWAMTLNAWRQGDFSWWDLVGLAPFIPAAGVRHADDLLDAVEDVTRRIPGVNYHYHHTVPREILNKYLPEEIANAPLVRGVKGAPNRWPIPEDIHKEIHKGPRGGLYNERWKEELAVITDTGRKVTVDDVLRIRDQLIREFGLEVYRP